MSREKRESEYPTQLESQFIIRLPQEPAKVLSELIKSGENFKNRLRIQINDDSRHGELRLDHWLLHAKIVDLPTIVESWKTIDRKSLYKSADICQMMICKEELDETTEEETPIKNKKRDPLKVDKKYLWPHGITPPTKNVRRRRFRKTLRKKCAESPEIEKEVKRLLRADNDALSFTWEVIKEEDEQVNKHQPTDLITLKEKNFKIDSQKGANDSKETSKVEDIFGDALSDSDIDDDNVNVGLKDRQPPCESSLTEANSPHGLVPIKGGDLSQELKADIFLPHKKKATTHQGNCINIPSSSYTSDDNKQQQSTSSSNDNLTLLQELTTDLEELKQRRQRTQLEISKLENLTLRQRFQDILKTINREIIMKEMEYHKLKTQTK
ncbi:transcription initiation factor TFIID subunit 7-like [Melitaea cinxia]|uniref:transcription initiation factor TFIID subunit 7-like n=1 Tax=Melitaea cinxia TaxID=113334 RepID=UPI001E27342F|nr:transcription initiation factor TFIID subunit 7-like [Melitaea cinxia]